MVGRGETGAGGLEASLGDQRGRGTDGGAGEHLGEVNSVRARRETRVERPNGFGIVDGDAP